MEYNVCWGDIDMDVDAGNPWQACMIVMRENPIPEKLPGPFLVTNTETVSMQEIPSYEVVSFLTLSNQKVDKDTQLRDCLGGVQDVYSGGNVHA